MSTDTPPSALTRARKTRSDGARSRLAILKASADLATTEGLAGLSIGSVAAAARMSKGGITAHFASKEALQLAVIEYALGVIDETVLAPASASEPGLDRLRGLCERHLDCLERKVFPGGCFRSAVSAEFAARGGPVKGRIAGSDRDWIALLARTVTAAIDRGEFKPLVDPEQLAFELNALLLAAHVSHQLQGGTEGIRRARRAIEQRIDQCRP